MALNRYFEIQTTRTTSVCLLVYMIYFPLAAQSTDSPQWVTHSSIRFRVIQRYSSWGLSQTHISHALAGSHTVDSPSSAEVINDFLWLSSNSPSIVNPLLLIEATPPFLSLSPSSRCYLCLSFRKRWLYGHTPSENRKSWQAGGGCFL